MNGAVMQREQGAQRRCALALFIEVSPRGNAHRTIALKRRDAMTTSSVVHIDAQPDRLSLDTAKTAVIVCDMQNDFGAEGGMFHRAGIDIAPIQAAVAPTARVLGAARAAGVQIVYLKMEFRPDLSDAGAPDLPNWRKHLPLGGIGEPDYGTRWSQGSYPDPRHVEYGDCARTRTRRRARLSSQSIATAAFSRPT